MFKTVKLLQGKLHVCRWKYEDGGRWMYWQNCWYLFQWWGCRWQRFRYVSFLKDLFFRQHHETLLTNTWIIHSHAQAFNVLSQMRPVWEFALLQHSVMLTIPQSRLPLFYMTQHCLWSGAGPGCNAVTSLLRNGASGYLLVLSHRQKPGGHAHLISMIPCIWPVKALKRSGMIKHKINHICSFPWPYGM